MTDSTTENARLDRDAEWNKVACIVCEERVPAYLMTNHHKAHAEAAVKTSVCRCGHGQDVHVTRCQGAIGGSKPCWCRSFENREEPEQQMKTTTVWGCPKCGNERDHFVPSPAPGFPSFYVCEHVPRLSDERDFLGRRKR